MVISLYDARRRRGQRDGRLRRCVDALTRRLLELALADARGDRRRVRLAGARQPGAARGAAQLRRRQRDRLVRRATREGARTTANGSEDLDPARLARSPATSSPACALAACARTRTGSTPIGSRSCARSRLLAARGPQLDRRSDPGEGADPVLGAARQPSRLGGPHRHARSPTPSGSPRSTRRCCGCWPASRCHTVRRPACSAAWWWSTAGEHRGRLDLKHGGLIPILDLARWGAISAGVTSASTLERLRAAGEAGTLTPEDAHTLRDAFELINNLRLEHQVAQLRAGRQPDDHVDPHELSALMRAQLRQAFRAVAGDPAARRRRACVRRPVGWRA